MTKERKTIWGRLNAGLGVLRNVAFAVFLVLILVVVVLVASLGGEEEIEIPAEAVLVFDPAGRLTEQLPKKSPLAGIDVDLEEADLVPLSDLEFVLEAAAEDDQIKVLLLRLHDLRGLSLVHIETLGAMFEKFKKSGKPIFAYGEGFNQGMYALASHANRVSLHPIGGVGLRGFGMHSLYFGEAFQKAGVGIHIYRSGKYKSAGEILERKNMSDEERMVREELLSTIWPIYTERLAANRKLSSRAINDYIDHYDRRLKKAGGHAEAALQFRLIDAIESYREMFDFIGELDHFENTEGRPESVHYERYLAYVRQDAPLDEKPVAKDRIALIVAEGPVVTERNDAGSDDMRIAADELSEEIRSARKDKNVKALVLRINTPGGSALASEQIREQLQLVREAGKSVVVSMSSVAASGGYWIAAGADEVWASPATITGSIGVIGFHPSLAEGMGKLGVYMDGVATNDLSKYTGVEPPPKKIATIVQLGIDDIYEKFLKLVAEARGLSVEEVHKIAQGRVWMAGKAKEIKLIDGIGNLDSALDAAARLAGLEKWSLKRKRPEESLLEAVRRLLSRATANPFRLTAAQILAYLPPAFAQHYRILTLLNDPQHTYAMCMACQINGLDEDSN